MRVRDDLAAAEVASVLRYDPDTGEFRWIGRRSLRVRDGDRAGSLSSRGYWCIRIGGVNYQAHRLAWLLVHGAWPNGEIDHVNGIKTDNRLENLREASRELNTRNLRTAKRTNRVGLLGVSRDGSKWRASIRLGGRNVYLGRFSDPGSAHRAHVEAKRSMHGVEIPLAVTP